MRLVEEQYELLNHGLMPELSAAGVETQADLSRQ